MYQNSQRTDSSTMVLSPSSTNPATQFEDFSSLGQVVRKFNGLIDHSSNSFLSSPQDKVVTRSDPIDIPKPGKQEPAILPCLDSFQEDALPSYLEVADPEFATQQIAEQIELAIKRAKTSTLSPCLEVLIPLNLTQQIAQDVLSSSDSEPCGLRGCILYVNLEDEHHEVQRIAVVRPAGSHTVATFELFLTLKLANSGWLNAVSNRVWKTLGRKSIVINESYQLSKRKLFRSDLYS